VRICVRIDKCVIKRYVGRIFVGHNFKCCTLLFKVIYAKVVIAFKNDARQTHRYYRELTESKKII